MMYLKLEHFSADSLRVNSTVIPPLSLIEFPSNLWISSVCSEAGYEDTRSCSSGFNHITLTVARRHLLLKRIHSSAPSGDDDQIPLCQLILLNKLETKKSSRKNK